MPGMWKKFQRSSPSLSKLPEKVDLPLVHVIWVDSCHSAGWMFTSEIEHRPFDLVQETAGFLLKETDYSYFIIQSKGIYKQGGDFAIDSTMEVPKVAVHSIVELTKKRKQWKDQNEKN